MRIKLGKYYYIQFTSEYEGGYALWWKPNRKGYTCDLIYAGLYSAKEAEEIVSRRPVDVAWEKDTAQRLVSLVVHREPLNNHTREYGVDGIRATNSQAPNRVDLTRFSTKDIARFHTNVDRKGDDECWPWKLINTIFTISLAPGRDRRASFKATRVAWVIAYGEIEPNDDSYVLHSCKQKKCMNPRHLYLADFDRMIEHNNAARHNKQTP